ncbi:TetR/AcrR family transcriptional regulator [Rhodococcus sp. H29-C3]|uniref:TetR/AcrR family transcriptional regulator n=1 Tax=Rhodococcus sp. H29-C3 TaxID=3046307 RepID=UPI0024B986F4|nr:TetR/AcrR family transcriptional regulator [Rhodococcus sp. H29-C3]MDJ0363355.1 TetR/AcrR family transcriptional regulator [Rhodococcus sp. H29-C3]
MVRSDTVRRVHAAVLGLAQRGGPGALTMEGIAAEAGVGKQTLYRNWPSVHAILFDALAGDDTSSTEPRASDTVQEFLKAAIDEISTEPRCSLLRMLAASIQTDAAVAREFHERLLAPQVTHIQRLVSAVGAQDPRQATELLLAPIFYRWFMRLPQFQEKELEQHVRSVLTPKP